MIKKKRASKPEKFTFEAFLHVSVHFFAALALFWIVAVPPLWIAVILMILEVAQMKYFGSCFLTAFAHKRGYMKGMTYWQYVPHLLGVKDYKKADRIISGAIKIALLAILFYRLARLFI